MSTDKTQESEREIYASAAKIGDPSERKQFVSMACGEDGPLRERINKLLAAKFDNGDNLLAAAVPASVVGEVCDIVTHLPSMHGEQNDAKLQQPKIDRYVLIEKIGQGGMGTVYMAEQLEPVRRKVALKVIKRGMDSEQVVARFEAERQALALMNHPNIAGVLDAGTTEDGRPFFVMELVRGVPINEYCDLHKLTRDDRLKLFQAVCWAVQHAHQKGIIHRDLKPSNILVELHDVSHVPKIIDFGVAKATSHRLTDKTLHTMFLQMVGTPLYMSPEQAQLSGLDVDTRSDIYSLGVVLYELLTGTTPFDRETFKNASLDEMRRIISEDEPLRPSQKISTLNRGQASTIAEKQSTDVRGLTGRPVRELDWIVTKTLEKDRSRRYESASALASDIQRFLSNEPVLACPPSLGYRLGKFTSRRKGVLLSATLILVSLLSGTTISIWYAAAAQQAARQAQAARQESEDAFRALNRESQAKDTALEHLKTSNAETEAVFEFLVKDLLKTASPFDAFGREKGSEITVAEALVNARQQVDTSFPDQPLLKARVESTIGEILLAQGKYEEAQKSLRRAAELRMDQLGELATETSAARSTWAESLWRLGQYSEAKQVYASVLQNRIEAKDTPAKIYSTKASLATVHFLLNEYNAAISLYQEVLSFRERPDQDPEDLLILLCNLGVAYQYVGEHELAKVTLERGAAMSAQEYGLEHPTTLSAKHNLSALIFKLGDSQAAISMMKEVLSTRRRVLGEFHPDTTRAVAQLGGQLESSGELESAKTLYLERLGGIANAEERTNQYVLGLAYRNLASVEGKLKEYMNANAHYDQACQILADVESTQAKAMLLFALNEYSLLLQEQKNFDRSIKILRDIVAIRQDTQRDSPTDLKNRVYLGGAYCNIANNEIKRNRFDESAENSKKAIEVLGSVVDAEPKHLVARSFLVNSFATLALAQSGRKEFDDAIATWNKALSHAPDDRITQLEALMAVSLSQAGRHKEAIETAAELRGRLDLDAEGKCNIAKVYAAAAHAAYPDSASLSVHRDLALALLKDADSEGLFDIPLERDDLLDDEFDALRDDPDFQKLLQDNGLHEGGEHHPE